MCLSLSANGLHYALCKPTLKAPGAYCPDRHPVVNGMVLGSDLRRGSGTTTRGRAAAGRGTALTAALVFLLGPAVTACGDDSGGSDAAPPTPSVEPTGGTGQSGQTAQTSSASATAPARPAAAVSLIRRNWQKFFDPDTSAKDKQAVLENGAAMAPVLRAFNGDRRGGQVAAKVTEVAFTSPTEATVTYTLTLNGATALPDASGTAVLEHGTWKVSDKTLCALVQLSGNASASALPGC